MPSSCCCVPGCANRGGHRFPKDDALRKLWIIAIKRDQKPGKLWQPSPSSVVCFQHFESTDYIKETTHGNIAVVLKSVSLILPMFSFYLLFC